MSGRRSHRVDAEGVPLLGAQDEPDQAKRMN